MGISHVDGGWQRLVAAAVVVSLISVAFHFALRRWLQHESRRSNTDLSPVLDNVEVRVDPNSAVNNGTPASADIKNRAATRGHVTQVRPKRGGKLCVRTLYLALLTLL